MILTRHNILELMGTRQNEFHSAVLTCYTFDPIFFESFFLPQLRRIGIVNVVVLVDSSNYDRLLIDYPSYGLSDENGVAGGAKLYSVVRQTPSSTGVFHPKISLFIGQNKGMLLIGSGNLTYNGFSLNEEIWGAFSTYGDNPKYLPIFHKAWSYIKSISKSNSLLVNQQYKWMIENASWLTTFNSDEDMEWVNTSEGDIKIIVNEQGRTILQQVDDIISNDDISTIDVVSPFIDVDGRIIESLRTLYKKATINCVFSRNGTYPLDYMKNSVADIYFYEWSDVFQVQRNFSSPLHAKILQFKSDNRTVLVLGSANFTTAALAGYNDEACIVLVSSARRDFVKELGVDLTPQKAVSKKEIEKLPESISYTSPYRKLSQIFNSEVIDGILTCSTSLPDGGVDIAFVNGVGKTLEIASAIVNCGKIVINFNAPSAIMIVAVDSSRNEITNRCFIIKDESVARFNPNQTFRRLESLLEASLNWKADLTPILSYITFEDYNGQQKNQKIKNDSVSGSKITGTKIDKKEFDNINIGGRQNLYTIPSIRIMDILLNSLRDHKTTEDTYEGADDIETELVIEDGDNIKEAKTLKQKNEVVDVSLTDCINKYSYRLSKYYNSKLEDLYKAAEKWGNDIYKDGILQYDKITSESFSHILIHAILLWKEMATNPESNYSALIGQYLHNLGQFHILAYPGYKMNNDFASNKTLEAHRNLTVYSLLIIANYRIGRRENHQVKLSILNLLDSFRNNSDITVNQIRQLFLQKLEEDTVKPANETLSLIEQTFSEYEHFSLHRDDGTMVRQICNFKGEYLYRRNIGFSYGVDFEPYIDINGRLGYKYSVNHPGFKSSVSYIGGTKIKALI